TAKDESKNYGATFSPDGTTQFTASGLLYSDTVSSVTLTSSGYTATATIAGSPYAITPSAAVGTGLGNYTISYATGNLTVNTVTSVTLTSAGSAAAATVAGSPYAITPSAAVGTGLANYTISYATGKLTVNAVTLTITAKEASKNYGQTVTFTGSEFDTAGTLY